MFKSNRSSNNVSNQSYPASQYYHPATTAPKKKTYDTYNRRQAVDEAQRGNKVFRSDEDRGRWVGDRWVDHKASDFIAKFHQACIFQAQTMYDDSPRPIHA